MPRFLHGPIEIDYLDEGDGDPIVLVHGIASTKEVNWVLPGWVSTLVKAGRRAIALDNRGHGQSTKLYEPADYHTDKMVEDVCGLLDHLALPRADVLGYSMGARIGAFMAAHRPARVRSAILGGLGIRLVDGSVDLNDDIAGGARSTFARRRAGPYRPAISCLCRADPVRPQGACGLPLGAVVRLYHRQRRGRSSGRS